MNQYLIRIYNRYCFTCQAIACHYHLSAEDAASIVSSHKCGYIRDFFWRMPYKEIIKTAIACYRQARSHHRKLLCYPTMTEAVKENYNIEKLLFSDEQIATFNFVGLGVSNWDLFYDPNPKSQGTCYEFVSLAKASSGGAKSSHIGSAKYIADNILWTNDSILSVNWTLTKKGWTIFLDALGAYRKRSLNLQS